MPKPGDLRVWVQHTLPDGDLTSKIVTYRYPVPSIKSALLLLEALAAYDRTLDEAGVALEADCTGLEIRSGPGWREWISTHGETIHEIGDLDRVTWFFQADVERSITERLANEDNHA